MYQLHRLIVKRICKISDASHCHKAPPPFDVTVFAGADEFGEAKQRLDLLNMEPVMDEHC